MRREDVERLHERARQEYRHRALGYGFRPGKYTGAATRDIRVEDRLARLDHLFGDTPMYAYDPGYAAPGGIGVREVAIGAAAIGGGYLLGRWFARHRGAHSLGLDVLGAR